MPIFSKGTLCIPAIAALGLSGCGTGGSAPQDGLDGGLENVAAAPKSYADLLVGLVALDDALVGLSPPIDMPAAGSASYEGVASLKQVQALNPQLLSQIVLTADFATATVDGQFFNFAVPEGGTVTGTLDVENGVIAGLGLTFDMGGSLTRNGKVAVIQGKGQGLFLGDGPDALLGGLSGTSKEGVQPVVNINGLFAGTRTP